MIKIIHIVLGKANPERLNGVNKVVHYLAESQSSLGYEVEIWGISFSDNHNYPSRYFKTLLFKDFKSKFKIDKDLIACIKNQKPNCIFHFHGGFIPQFYKISKILKKHNLKYILTPHGAYNVIALERSKFRKRVYIKLFENKLVKNAYKIHLIGRSEIIGLQNIFGKVPYYLLQNGQHVSMAANINKNKKFIIGYCGRYDMKTKGLDKLIYALKKINDTDLDVELHLYGGGPDKDELMALTKSCNLEGKVKINGPIYNKQKIIAFGSFNLFCLFSRNEGMPGVVLESLSVGTPCMVSHETNLNDYFKDSNIAKSINCEIEEDICKELENFIRFLKNSDPNKIIIDCKNLLKTNFNWNKIASNHIKNYE